MQGVNGSFGGRIATSTAKLSTRQGPQAERSTAVWVVADPQALISTAAGKDHKQSGQGLSSEPQALLSTAPGVNHKQTDQR